jgi:GNAT superfamily N-acetyltransferase
LDYSNDNYTISTDPSRLDFDVIHHFLTNSYWSPGVPFATVKKAAENSLCFGVYEGDKQVGYARVVTDYTTYAYIADVFIVESHRGQGLGKWLMGCVVEYPELQGLRLWMLATRDAHGLYEQVGFEALPHPERFMQINRPDIYNSPPDD